MHDLLCVWRTLYQRKNRWGRYPRHLPAHRQDRRTWYEQNGSSRIDSNHIESASRARLQLHSLRKWSVRKIFHGAEDTLEWGGRNHILWISSGWCCRFLWETVIPEKMDGQAQGTRAGARKTIELWAHDLKQVSANIIVWLWENVQRSCISALCQKRR